MPRFKAQAVGSIVYYTHSVVLESVKQRGMMLHTSMVPYSNIPSTKDASLPKCLQTEKTLETNLSMQVNKNKNKEVVSLCLDMFEIIDLGFH